jgi:uncharacterized membrane protein
MVITKTANILPINTCEGSKVIGGTYLEAATAAILTEFNINSTDIKIAIILDLITTPVSPIQNKIADIIKNPSRVILFSLLLN